MLRSTLRSSSLKSPLARLSRSNPIASFATQSGDDAQPPTALAKLHLEDGTTLTARSFGSHEAVEGEVRVVVVVRSRGPTFNLHLFRSFSRLVWSDTLKV